MYVIPKDAGIASKCCIKKKPYASEVAESYGFGGEWVDDELDPLKPSE